MRSNATPKKRRTIEENAKLFQKWRAKKSSIKEIAKAMELNPKYLYKILPRIAATLGIPYEELIFQQHKITESSGNSSSEISNELQNKEVITAEETAESVVVDVVAEATEEANTTTEAQATVEEEVETITSTEEVAAPETEVSNEEKEEVQDIPTNATLVEILNTLAEAKKIIESLNIVQEVTK